jgi:phosphoacetylglucosamine mutase
MDADRLIWPQDNGVKLVDPRGEMLEASWEGYATLLANALTPEALQDSLTNIITSAKIDLKQPCLVIYGHDTRPSCPSLVQALEDGLNCFTKDNGGKTVNAGLVTTPQLHYLVRAINTQGTEEAFGEPTEAGYYDKLAKAYLSLTKGKPRLSTLTVDCANGVGGPKLRKLVERIGAASIDVEVVKDDTTTPGALNSNCGADYVKTGQRAPPGIQLTANGRYCSLDGDADRIVFYYATEDGTFRLLDGDKIAGLAAMFLIELVKQAGLELEVGVVQTAYANGSSTAYLKNVLVSQSIIRGSGFLLIRLDLFM